MSHYDTVGNRVSFSRRGHAASAFTPALGIAWRPDLALPIQRRADATLLGFVEILAEDFNPDSPLPKPLEQLLERGIRVIPHGVSLSLGSAEPLDRAKIKLLAQLARR